MSSCRLCSATYARDSTRKQVVPVSWRTAIIKESLRKWGWTKQKNNWILKTKSTGASNDTHTLTHTPSRIHTRLGRQMKIKLKSNFVTATGVVFYLQDGSPLPPCLTAWLLDRARQGAHWVCVKGPKGQRQLFCLIRRMKQQQL